jgi:hypothetical protein
MQYNDCIYIHIGKDISLELDMGQCAPRRRARAAKNATEAITTIALGLGIVRGRLNKQYFGGLAD